MSNLHTEMSVTADAARKAGKKVDTKAIKAKVKAIAAQGPTAVELPKVSLLAKVGIPTEKQPYDVAAANAKVLRLMAAASKPSAKLQAQMKATPEPQGQIDLAGKVVTAGSAQLVKAAARKARDQEIAKVVAKLASAKKSDGSVSKIARVEPKKAPARVVEDDCAAMDMAVELPKSSKKPAPSTAFNKATSAKATAAKVEANAPKKASVKQAILDLFYGDKFTGTTAETVALLQKIHAGMNESSIRVWISDFRADGSLLPAKGVVGPLKVGTPGKFALRGTATAALATPATDVKAPKAKANRLVAADTTKNVVVNGKQLKTGVSIVDAITQGFDAIKASGKKASKKAQKVVA